MCRIPLRLSVDPVVCLALKGGLPKHVSVGMTIHLARLVSTEKHPECFLTPIPRKPSGRLQIGKCVAKRIVIPEETCFAGAPLMC